MSNDFEVICSGYGAFPLGVQVYADYVHFAVEVSCDKKLYLCLYDTNPENTEPAVKIEFPEENRLGDIRYVDVKGIDIDKSGYSFEYSDGMAVKDLYARRVSGWEAWGDGFRHDVNERYGFADNSFDWEDDKHPKIPLNETIIYRMHVRGFTKHKSSKVQAGGTFAGIAEKIPYLKELGITTVELMLPVEFNEVRSRSKSELVPGSISNNINYWGYGSGYYFAPKAAYASGNPVTEFKKLVKAMHRAGLEIITEFYFDNSVNSSYVLECIRYWVENYHIDGVRLGGNVPYSAVSEEAAFKDIKLFAESWEGCRRRKNLISYNDDYMNDMRRFLKGDENTLERYLCRMTANPKDGAVVNYFANNNTLTMMDMVSYDIKHNEPNGEDNRDGRDYNFSWNCGVEGSTKKKSVLELRRKLLLNAYTMLFISQGIPVLRAGDEMGQSKQGNNNAYCQDNETSWLDWNLLSSNSDIFNYVKKMIDFRKKHDLFRKEEPLRENDYKALGMSEFSIHGVKPWYPQYEYYRRQLGLLYFGRYSETEDKSSFYVLANMHWESHEFMLPKLPEKKKWSVMTDTSIIGEMDVCKDALENQEAYTVQPRTMVILRASD